jgi:LPS O-antigen subunit length determinant protein (WzzB/FepE family)
MKPLPRADSRGEKGVTQMSSRNPTHFQPQASNRDLFSYKSADKKLKPDKIYRFQCQGYLDHGTDKSCKKVEYKAEYNRPVEEFIYPSLQFDTKEVSKGSSQSSYDSRNLKWKFKEEEIKPTELPSRNSLTAKLEKGERYLQENLKTKYHGRILAELKEKEDKAAAQSKTTSNLVDLAGALQYPRRDNVVKTLSMFQKKIPDDETNADDLVSRSSLCSS